MYVYTLISTLDTIRANGGKVMRAMKKQTMKMLERGVYSLKPSERMNVVWLTRKDLSEMLQCSQNHVSMMVKNEKFPKPMKCGRRLLWHPKVVDRWILERCA